MLKLKETFRNKEALIISHIQQFRFGFWEQEVFLVDIMPLDPYPRIRIFLRIWFLGTVLHYESGMHDLEGYPLNLFETQWEKYCSLFDLELNWDNYIHCLRHKYPQGHFYRENVIENNQCLDRKVQISYYSKIRLSILRVPLLIGNVILQINFYLFVLFIFLFIFLTIFLLLLSVII